jgi:hypothetical protein
VNHRVALSGTMAASASSAMTMAAVGMNTCGRIRWRTGGCCGAVLCMDTSVLLGEEASGLREADQK